MLSTFDSLRFGVSCARLHLISSSFQLLIQSQIIGLASNSCSGRSLAFLFSKIQLALLCGWAGDRLCVACSFFLFLHFISFCFIRLNAVQPNDATLLSCVACCCMFFFVFFHYSVAIDVQINTEHNTTHTELKRRKKKRPQKKDK